MYRSPLAAALFRARLAADGRGGWDVDSAGTWTKAGQPVPVEMVRAAAKFGLHLEDHLSQEVSADLLSRFNLVLVMERGHKEALDQEFPFASEKTHLLSQAVDRMEYDIPDPLRSGQELDVLVSDLHKLIARGVDSIYELAESGFSHR